jgi:hypothetical protein
MSPDIFHSMHSMLDHTGIAAELLPESDGSGVLQVGPPDFDDVVKLFGFLLLSSLKDEGEFLLSALLPQVSFQYFIR